MAKLRLIQNSMNAGEISPRLRGRTDIPRYANGLESCRNAIPTVEGGAFRRPGSRHVAQAAGADVRLIPFHESTGGTLTGWLLEFSALAVRFYTNGVQVMDGPDPLELATPYAAADLAAIHYNQSDNTLYLWHGDHHPRRLVRTATAWTIETVPFTNYPYQRPEGTEAVTLSASAVSGAVTVTSNLDYFLAGHVGMTMGINGGLAQITAYTNAKTVSATMVQPIIVPVEMKRYTDTVTVAITKAALGGGVTVAGYTFLTKKQAGSESATIDLNLTVTVTPDPLPAGITYTKVTNYDNVDGLEQHTSIVTLSIDSAVLAADATVTITAYSERKIFSGLAEILRDAFSYDLTTTLPADQAGVVSTKVSLAAPMTGTEADSDWNEIAWSDLRGWPRCGGLFEQRLLMAGSNTYPTTLWGSRTGKPLDLTVGTLDDDGFSFTLVDAATGINHLTVMNRIFIFSHSKELTLDSGEKPLTPTTPNIKTRGANGSSPTVQPVHIGNQIFFVSPSGKRLQTMEYDLNVDDYIATDLSVFSSHFTGQGGGITAMAYSREPYGIIWAVTTAGHLLSITIDKRQDVVAWARQTSSGSYKDGAVVSGGSNNDEVWLAVARTVNGTTTTRIERLDYSLNTDSAVTATASPAKVEWTGLGHLEGETVDILADGFVAVPQAVTGGKITLPYPASAVEVGLNYTTTIKDLPVELAQQGTTAQGSNMAVAKTIVRLFETRGCMVNGERLPFQQFGDQLLDQPASLFTGDKTISTLGRGTAPEQSQTTIVQDKPLPLTVLAIIKQVAIND